MWHFFSLDCTPGLNNLKTVVRTHLEASKCEGGRIKSCVSELHFSKWSEFFFGGSWFCSFIMYVCILHINNTKNRTHTEPFMDGWFWTSAMSLQVFQEKKTNQRQKKGDKSRQPEREREKVTQNKPTKKAYLKRESRESCNSLLHRDSHLPFLSFPFFFLSCSVLLAPLPQYQDVVARSNISVLALLLPVHIHTELCLSYVQASAPAWR